MTVNPGFGGQLLIPECLKKVSELDEIRRKEKYKFLISVDGGINEHTAKDAVSAGADILVSGSSFFGSRHYDRRLAAFVAAAEGRGNPRRGSEWRHLPAADSKD